MCWVDGVDRETSMVDQGAIIKSFGGKGNLLDPMKKPLIEIICCNLVSMWLLLKAKDDYIFLSTTFKNTL